MPTDVPMSPKRHEVRRLNTLCDPAIHQESIEEEEEETAEEEVKQDDGIKRASHRLSPSQLTRNPPQSWSTHGSLSLLLTPDSRLVRKGPGYSELSPIPENVSNEKTEMLQQLVSKIEQACESMDQEAWAISDGKELTLSPSHSPVNRSSSNLCTVSTSNDAPIFCTIQSSSPSSASQQSSNNSGIYNISSFTRPSLSRTSADHVTPHNNQSAIDDSSFTLSSHESHHLANKGIKPSAMLAGKTQVMFPDFEKTSSEYRKDNPLYPDCTTAVQCIGTGSDITGTHEQTSLQSASSGKVQVLENISNECVEHQRVSEETIIPESEIESMKTECEDHMILQMDAHSTGDDHTPMEEEESNITEETSKYLDDLFIQESPTDLPVVIGHLYP